MSKQNRSAEYVEGMKRLNGLTRVVPWPRIALSSCALGGALSFLSHKSGEGGRSASVVQMKTETTVKVDGPAPRSKHHPRGLGTPSEPAQKGAPRPGQARAISRAKQHQANQAKCQCCGPAWVTTVAICYSGLPPSVPLCSRDLGVSGHCVDGVTQVQYLDST